MPGQIAGARGRASCWSGRHSESPAPFARVCGRCSRCQTTSGRIFSYRGRRGRVFVLLQACGAVLRPAVLSFERPVRRRTDRGWCYRVGVRCVLWNPSKAGCRVLRSRLPQGRHRFCTSGCMSGTRVRASDLAGRMGRGRDRDDRAVGMIDVGAGGALRLGRPRRLAAAGLRS